MKNSKRILSLMLSAVMLLALAPFAVNANAAKPADYANVLYYENFEGDTELDADTTMKYGNATATIKSGDSDLTTEEESGNYLELKDETVNNNSLQFGVEYEAATSPVESKYPVSEVAKLAKMQVSFDLCLVDIDRQINVYFRDKLSTASTKSVSLMSIKPDGTLSFSAVGADRSYTEGEWASFDFYFDFLRKTYSLYIDGVVAFEDAVNDTALDTCIESFVFQAGSMAEGEKYTFYVDNMRIAIPREYDSDLAELDFENIAADTVLKWNTDTRMFSSNWGGGTATVVQDDADHGNVLNFTSSNGIAYGVAVATTQAYPTYVNYGQYPSIIKAQVDVKKAGATANNVFLCFDSNKKLVEWRANGNFYFSGSSTAAVDPSTSKAIWKGRNAWAKVELYINFATGTYDAYIDGISVGTYALVNNITIPERFVVRTEVADTVCFDNMRVSTITPYEAKKVTQYLDKEGYKYGYVLNNADAENAISYNVYCAKYELNGRLVDVEITPDSVAAGKLEFKVLESKAADEGYYYRYFVWEDETLVPLLEVE